VTYVEQTEVVLTLFTHSREVHGSNLGMIFGHPDIFFFVFFLVPSMQRPVVHSYTLRPPHTKSLAFITIYGFIISKFCFRCRSCCVVNYESSGSYLLRLMCSLLHVEAVNFIMCYAGGRDSNLVLVTAYLDEFLMVFMSVSRQLLG
jgi:hypothetical protein